MNWFTRFTALSGILKARVSERKRENAGANLNEKLELSGILLKVARLRDEIEAKYGHRQSLMGLQRTSRVS